MPKWMPIETAPLSPFSEMLRGSDRLLLAIHGGRMVTIGSYGYTPKGKGRWRDDHCAVIKPTHWMPLPSPPE